MARGLIRPATKVVWPVDIEGLDHLPPSGGAIIAPNHISFLDSVVLIGVLPRRITYVGKAEYLDNWKTRFLFPAVGMIPIDRTGGKASMAALDTAARVLESRPALRHLPRGHPLAATACSTGAAPASPAWRCAPVSRSCRWASSAPTASSRRARPCPGPSSAARSASASRSPWTATPARTGDGRVFRELTDEIMFEIATLSGQQYVDRYAERQAERDADSTASSGREGRRGGRGTPAGTAPATLAGPTAVSGAAGA